MELSGVAQGEQITVHFKDRNNVAGDFIRGRFFSIGEKEIVIRVGNAQNRIYIPLDDIKYVEHHDGERHLVGKLGEPQPVGPRGVTSERPSEVSVHTTYGQQHHYIVESMTRGVLVAIPGDKDESYHFSHTADRNDERVTQFYSLEVAMHHQVAAEKQVGGNICVRTSECIDNEKWKVVA